MVNQLENSEAAENLTLTWGEHGDFRFGSRMPEVPRNQYVDWDEVLYRLSLQATGPEVDARRVESALTRLEQMDRDDMALWLEFLALVCGITAGYDGQHNRDGALGFHSRAYYAFCASTVIECFEPVHEVTVSNELHEGFLDGLDRMPQVSESDYQNEEAEGWYHPLAACIFSWFPNETVYERDVLGLFRASRAGCQQRLFSTFTSWLLSGGGHAEDAQLTAEPLKELYGLTFRFWPPEDWYQ